MINIKSVLQLIRVKQWYKNLLVLTPLLFGDLLFSLDVLFSVIIATLVFCAVSGIIYILNDIRDKERDSHHPKKLKRPLPSGAISVKEALFLVVILFILTIIGLTHMNPLFGCVIGLYIVQNIAYTYWLKNVAIVDVIVIGVGFVLRVLAGCIVADVFLSPWLFTAAFLLALLLGFSKRYSEIGIIESAIAHRPVLGEYNGIVLQAYLILSATAVLMVYLIYAITGSHTSYFVLTIPFAIFGIFSFLSKSLISGLDPDDLLKEYAFLTNLLLWFAVVVLVLYGF
ncbi:UbiA family prenyltransferase [Methanospirillum stamsii]|uniref:UbiA family prenyltransferase n=1 Tax=Methanospirillum stamsii TaxID=1277351 RepID=UPI0015E852FB|nr:UbiA family prenyltransferase [Methanospirillum stamsii]